MAVATATPASKYEQWIELLTKSIPSPRRRIRRSPVPYFEWIGAFKLTNTLIANLYRKAASKPEIRAELPPAFGAILRIIINKRVLPEIRKYLAVKKGIESPKEALDIIVKVIEEFLGNEEMLREYLKSAIESYGIRGANLEQYVKVAKAVLTEMKKYVEEVAKKLEEQLAKTTKAAKK